MIEPVAGLATSLISHVLPILTMPPDSRLAHSNLGFTLWSTVLIVAAVLEHGVKTVQLRMKDCHGEQLEEAIKQAIALGRAHDAQVFINDHWQLALKHGAYGVHLGQQDLHNANLRAIQDAGLRLGLSTHGFYEMLLAHNYRPSYIALGAIYPTTTKDMTGQIQGLQKLRHFVPLMQAHYPTVAIGGIDLTRIAEVVNTGVGSVAVVRAITEAAHPTQAIAQLQQAIKDGRSEQ